MQAHFAIMLLAFVALVFIFLHLLHPTSIAASIAASSQSSFTGVHMPNPSRRHMRAEGFRLRWTSVMLDWNNKQLLADALVKEMLSALDPAPPEPRQGPPANAPACPSSQVHIESDDERGNVAQVPHAPESDRDKLIYWLNTVPIMGDEAGVELTHTQLHRVTNVEALCKIHAACRTVDGCALVTGTKHGHIYKQLKEMTSISSDRLLASTYPELSVGHSWISHCILLADLHKRLPNLVCAKITSSELRAMKMSMLLEVVLEGSFDQHRWGASEEFKRQEHLARKERRTYQAMADSSDSDFEPARRDRNGPGAAFGFLSLDGQAPNDKRRPLPKPHKKKNR